MYKHSPVGGGGPEAKEVPYEGVSCGRTILRCGSVCSFIASLSLSDPVVVMVLTGPDVMSISVLVRGQGHASRPCAHGVAELHPLLPSLHIHVCDRTRNLWGCQGPLIQVMSGSDG